MASTSRIGAVLLTLLLVATWVAAPVPTWLSTPAAAQKKKEDEKAARKKAKADPKGTKKDPKAAAAEKAAREKAKAKAAKDAAKTGKIPAASINKPCCYSEKAKCEGTCGFTGSDRTTACRQECEGLLRNCLGAGIFITRRGSQVVCAKR
jgi:hypothetical protein